MHLLPARVDSFARGSGRGLGHTPVQRGGFFVSTHKGWIGVDLDGTLAHYDGWKGAEHIGEPVPKMLDRVKAWIAEGREVRIFTARVYEDGSVARDLEVRDVRANIAVWCMKHLGKILVVTCEKDFAMVELWDDRAVQIIPNTGERADGK